MCDGQLCGVLFMMFDRTSLTQGDDCCSRPLMWMARARVRTTTRFNSSDSPYRTMLGLLPGVVWFLGAVISALPSPRKTRPVLDPLQDCCKMVIVFMVVSKGCHGYHIIQRVAKNDLKIKSPSVGTG